MEAQHDIQLLIRQLNGGSEQAFDRIYRLFSPRVFSFALSLSNDKTEAEEIVQEVFLKLWAKRREISTSGSLESYLFTMSKNALLNSIRKNDYHRVFLDYKRNNPEPDPALDQEIAYRELEGLYHQAIQKLSPRKREIFLLSRKQFLSYDEIAQKLGISTKTVRNQMDAAISDIKQLITRLGFTGLLILTVFIK